MQTYATQTKKKSTNPGAWEKRAPVREIPNSIVSSLATNATELPDPELLAKIKSRSSGVPGHMQAQIPTAEREADSLSAGVGIGTSSPEAVKTEMGSRLGADFSNVQFHTGSKAESYADIVEARAYTTGSDIYFGEGGFDPQVAAHELVHTAQQGVTDAAVPTVAAPTGGVQMWPGSKKKRQKKEAKARRADALRAAIAAYESRGSSVRAGMTKNVIDRGETPNDENTRVGSLSRSAQAMMIPGNESYNAKVTDYFTKNQIANHKTGPSTLDTVLDDPEKMEEMKRLMKPHVDFILNANIDSINIDDTDSLVNNMELLTRCAMIGQAIDDMRHQCPDLAGSEERTKELLHKTTFANHAFVLARYKIAEEQGWKDDTSLYTKTDYSVSSEHLLNGPAEGVFSKSRAKEKLGVERRRNAAGYVAEDGRGVGLIGQKNFKDYMSKREPGWQPTEKQPLPTIQGLNTQPQPNWFDDAEDTEGVDPSMYTPKQKGKLAHRALQQEGITDEHRALMQGNLDAAKADFDKQNAPAKKKKWYQFWK